MRAGVAPPRAAVLYIHGVSFRLERPAGRPVPVLVEIPHAGLDVPAPWAATLDAPAERVQRDADLWVDELFAGARELGAVYLRATVSRYVLDLNRNVEDIDSALVPGLATARPNVPRGVLWREGTDGRPVHRRPLRPEEFRARIEALWRPYHAALEGELLALRQRFGFAILLSGHSMPSAARHPDGSEGPRRADVVPGTLGRSTAARAAIDVVEQHFRTAGMTVRHDEPYRGGATTARWGRPAQGLHAVQVELNRALYMDERSLARREGFRWVASLCAGLVDKLGALEL